MSYGRTKEARSNAARKHARKSRTCPRCNRTIKGNGYFNHKRACEKRFWNEKHQYKEPEWGGM